MHNASLTFDLIIIGGGPVGIFAAFQAGMSGIKKIAIIDNLDFLGGQCSALYPEKPIYDIPGFLEITGKQLVDNLSQQASVFQPHFFLKHQAKSITREDSKIILEANSPVGSVKFQCTYIIVAAGAGAFTPNRPPLAGIENLEGKQVFYAVPNADSMRDKHVVIAGGGDSALDWAIMLEPYAASIALVHRRPKFRAAPATVEQLESLSRTSDKLRIYTPFQLQELILDASGIMSAITIMDFENNIQKLQADVLLPCFGLSMDLGPINSWGLELAKRHIQVDPGSMRSNLENIYAIGDIASYPGKLKLILSGFSEAAIACADIRCRINPDAPAQLEHSTSRGKPCASQLQD